MRSNEIIFHSLLPVKKNIDPGLRLPHEFALSSLRVVGWATGVSVTPKDGVNEETAQPGMVRTRRPRWFSLPKLDEEPGLAPRPVRWAPRHRDLQHLVGTDTLQRPLSRARRICETRGVGSRRFSPGISRHVVGWDATTADRHAVSEPCQHGRGRVDSWQSH